MNVQTLHYASIAPGLPFHAALVLAESSDFAIQAHDHDFAEFMLILEGTGVHRLNGKDFDLEAGQVWSIAAHDAHSILAQSGTLTYVNVAFPLDTWQKFAELAEIGQPSTMAVLGSSSLAEVSKAFRKALAAFASGPSGLDLVEFFSVVGRGAEAQPSNENGPGWLRNAVRKMRQEENLYAGLPRLLELCSVSPAHLSRTVRQVYGIRPTDLVNAYRLEHAKTLLATTVEDTETIAFRCGFNNAPYFYRMFRKTVGATPRGYRLAIRRRVAPWG